MKCLKKLSIADLHTLLGILYNAEQCSTLASYPFRSISVSQSILHIKEELNDRIKEIGEAISREEFKQT